MPQVEAGGRRPRDASGLLCWEQGAHRRSPGSNEDPGVTRRRRRFRTPLRSRAAAALGAAIRTPADRPALLAAAARQDLAILPGGTGQPVPAYRSDCPWTGAAPVLPCRQPLAPAPLTLPGRMRQSNDVPWLGTGIRREFPAFGGSTATRRTSCTTAGRGRSLGLVGREALEGWLRTQADAELDFAHVVAALVFDPSLLHRKDLAGKSTFGRLRQFAPQSIVRCHQRTSMLHRQRKVYAVVGGMVQINGQPRCDVH